MTQDGQQVSWSVNLAHPFSPGGLARDKRSLCLLIEGGHGKVSNQLCVAGPRPGGKSARVEVVPPNGKPRFIAATVKRKSSHNLTATFTPASIGISFKPTRWQVSSTLVAPGCGQSAPGSPPKTGTCRALFPRTAAVAKLHAPQLVGCVARGAPFVFSGPSNQGKVVALTFDDGPWVQTAQFLNVLEHYHVHATFFEIGEQISTYGEDGAIERRMLADGDMIGDHTWSHPDVSGGGTFARDQIIRAAAAIKTATHGFQPCLFRAPYGAVSSALFAVTKSLGFKTIQWDVDPVDWSRPGTAAIEERVLSARAPGRDRPPARRRRRSLRDAGRAPGRDPDAQAPRLPLRDDHADVRDEAAVPVVAGCARSASIASTSVSASFEQSIDRASVERAGDVRLAGVIGARARGRRGTRS